VSYKVGPIMSRIDRLHNIVLPICYGIGSRRHNDIRQIIDRTQQEKSNLKKNKEKHLLELPAFQT
jgi:hypothetical protein